MNRQKYLNARVIGLLCVVMLGGGVVGCAVAGQGDDDVTPTVDASVASVIDAPRAPTADANKNPPDAFAFPPVDASTQPPRPDATPTSSVDAAAGLFCNGPADCPLSTECCLTLGGPGACVPGDDSLGFCIPD